MHNQQRERYIQQQIDETRDALLNSDGIDPETEFEIAEEMLQEVEMDVLLEQCICDPTWSGHMLRGIRQRVVDAYLQRNESKMRQALGEQFNELRAA